MSGENRRGIIIKGGSGKGFGRPVKYVCEILYFKDGVKRKTARLLKRKSRMLTKMYVKDVILDL